MSFFIFIYIFLKKKLKNKKHLTGSLKNLYTVKNMFGMAGFTTSCCHLAIFIYFLLFCVIFITDQLISVVLYILINYFSIFIVSVLLFFILVFNLIFFFFCFSLIKKQVKIKMNEEIK